MKKLLLTVLALIVMAGTIFAPSKAWSQSDCLIEDAYFQSDYLGDGLITTAICPASAVIQENVLQNNNIAEKTIVYDLTPVATTPEELGVSSWPSISCSMCSTVNSEHDITDYRLGEKRVAILLC